MGTDRPHSGNDDQRSTGSEEATVHVSGVDTPTLVREPTPTRLPRCAQVWLIDALQFLRIASEKAGFANKNVISQAELANPDYQRHYHTAPEHDKPDVVCGMIFRRGLG